VKREEVKAVLLEELGNVAPDADLAALDPSADLRQAIDIDSMDFLNWMIALHKRLGVEVPEADYGKLATLGGAAAYVAARLGA
jgi:acyl carrier protein